MAAVISGWMAGYAMACISTIVFTILLARSREGALVERWVAREVSSKLLAVPIFMGATFAWTAIGLIFGSVYEVGGFAEGPGGFGSPSSAFTLGMLGLAVIPLPIALVLTPGHWRLWLMTSLCFAFCFGWMLPVTERQFHSSDTTEDASTAQIGHAQDYDSVRIRSR